MSDAEIGAAVRHALDRDGALATLHLRRGHDGYSAALHVYAAHVDPRRPELGLVCDGAHARGAGETLDEALAEINRRKT